MRGSQFAEFSAFAAVAEQGSFTKAAAQLGVSTSALSQTIRALEERVGVRLLNRTTRSVAPTEAGERLYAQLLPAFDGFERAIEGINAFREKPMGTLRLLMTRPTAFGVMDPVLTPFLDAYPDIALDLVVDDGHVDLVSGRFDAGLTIGERIERDMIAVRLVEGVHITCVASPAYLERHGTPETPEDLREHQCIRVRSQWDGMVRPWHFLRDGESLDVVIGGRLQVNDMYLALRAAAAGIGIAYLPRNTAVPFVANQRLVLLLERWCPVLSGVYIYYPSRRQIPAPLQAFIDFARKAAAGQTA
jgi:DNA-binding transcriptional LysR family regulator